MTAAHLPLPIMIGFEGDEPDLAWMQAIRPAAVILFARNIHSAEQVRSLTASLRRLNPSPVVAIDEEGGRVHRLESALGPFPAPPSWQDESHAHLAGSTMGMMLNALGIHINLAPVVDLNLKQADNALQHRTLGKDPQTVARLAAAHARGLRSQGIVPCFKHFPGLGSTEVDSHLSLPTLALSESNWRRNEATVYSILAQTGMQDEPVMLAHCRIPFWNHEIASVSPRAVQALRSMGMRGPLLTDDLEMKALDQSRLPDLACQALDAGLDLVLVCRDAHKVQDVASGVQTHMARHPHLTDRWQRQFQCLRPATMEPSVTLDAAQSAWHHFVQAMG